MDEYGSLGVHLTHIGVLFDFYSGWAPPRHLYTADVYRVWGNLAFASDDFWAHAVMGLLFPRYQDSSYYHDERGFNTGTPFGDGMDALLTDVPSFILERYPVVIVATRLRAMRREVAAKLTQYIESGGILIMTAEASESLGLPLLGAMVPSMEPSVCTDVLAGAAIDVDGITVREASHVEAVLCPIVSRAGSSSKVVASVGGVPAAVQVTPSAGDKGGSLLLLASSGVAAKPAVALPLRAQHTPLPNIPPQNYEPDEIPLDNPFPMLNHVRSLLEPLLASQTPFDVATRKNDTRDLSVIVSRVNSQHYIVAVANNGLEELPLNISSRLGRISKITEIPLHDAPGGHHAIGPQTPGYLPSPPCPCGLFHGVCPCVVPMCTLDPTTNPRGVPCHNHTNTTARYDVGTSGDGTIAGLDQRLFAVSIVDGAATADEIASAPYPKRPVRRALPLPLGAVGASMQEQLLLRPSFFEKWDSAVVDYRYVAQRTAESLATEGRWAYKQGLRVIVDFSSGLNMFPDLRLINNSVEDYTRSLETMESVLSKMATLVNASTASQNDARYSADAIVTLHMTGGDGSYVAESHPDFVRSYKRLTAYAAPLQITLHLRVGAQQGFGWGFHRSEASLFPKPPHNLSAAVSFLEQVGDVPNFKIALPTAPLLQSGVLAADVSRTVKSIAQVGMIMAATPVREPLQGVPLSPYGPLARCDNACVAAMRPLLAIARKSGAIVVADASLPTETELHQDAAYLEATMLDRLAD